MNKKQRKQLRKTKRQAQLAAARAVPGTPVTRRVFRWTSTNLLLRLPIHVKRLK